MWTAIINFLGKYWYFPVLIFAIILLWLQRERTKELEQENKQTKNSLFISQEEMKTYKNSQNQTVGIANISTLDKTTFNQLLNDKLKSFSKDIKNSVSQYSELGFTNNTSFTAYVKDTLIFDTLKVKIFNYNTNPHLKFTCIISDSAKCSYEYRDTMKVVSNLKQNWKWYQFRLKKEMKSKGYDKYSPEIQIVLGDTNAKPTYIYSVKKQEDK